MAENPFESAPARSNEREEKSNYFVQISASKDNLALAQKIVKNIQDRVDTNARPLWIDSKGIGIFLSTELVAHEIWNESFHDTANLNSNEAKDILVLKVGDDWAARKDTTTANWLTSHAGSPRIAPPRSGKRR